MTGRFIAAALLLAPRTVAQNGPSFNCIGASGAVEKLVCGDSRLAILDHSLNDAYTKAMRRWPEKTKSEQRTRQQAWIAKRDACATEPNPGDCVALRYRERLVEVQILGKQLKVPAPAVYACPGRASERLTATFYNQTDPKSVLVVSGDREAVAFLAISASGARYVADGIEFWEHHGEARVKWSGADYTCKVAGR
jgi:uncharacterized protein